MSKVKNPQQKKNLSLDHDRCNRYGECPASSRKNIAKGQQRRNTSERRVVPHVLSALKPTADEDVAAEAEFTARVDAVITRTKGFRKRPDQPLRPVIAEELERRKK